MADLPDSELLVRNFTDPTWVRVTFVFRPPFGLFAAAGAKRIAVRVRRDASQFTSVVSISEPEIQGGVFVMDFRVTRSVEVGRLRRELADLARGEVKKFGGGLAKLDVTSIERIARVNIQRETAPAERQRTAIEAEETRRETTFSPARALAQAAAALKIGRGLIIIIIVGAGLFVAFPFLKTAGTALRARQRLRGG